jgi:GT2 family glycosyltransferase
MKSVGAVVIGRNEGERLQVCLRSMPQMPIVYVDSGSTDGSVAFAQSIGVDVVALDMSMPFTAARARNQGMQRLRELHPHVAYVQFVDGDCELHPTWMAAASKYLDDHADVAAVAGRLRERHPDRSIYNALCDDEWNTPIGEARACGGITMMRVAAFVQVGGFRNDLIAGEEPELCVRLRAAGHRIWRIDEEMALHDAAMTQFKQWFQRTKRGGYAFTEGARMHGKTDGHWVREHRRILLWGAALPLLVIVSCVVAGPWGLLWCLLVPLQMLRLALRKQGPARLRVAHGFFTVLGKWPEMLGLIEFHRRRWKREQSKLIEYK